MITAKKNKRFEKLFYSYLKKYLLKRHFHTIELEGKLDVENSLPVLYIANHSSWWDGLLLFYMTQQQSNQEHYVMMDEQGVMAYPFFRKVGAYSINRSLPKDIVRTLRYSEQLLRDQHVVWIFPQGQIQHQAIRPFHFQSGIGYLLQQFEQVNVKPISFHYYFGESQKPIASIRAGEQQLIEGSTQSRAYWTSYFERVLQEQVDAHQMAVIQEEQADLLLLMQPSKSTSDRFDAFKKGVKKWIPFLS